MCKGLAEIEVLAKFFFCHFLFVQLVENSSYDLKWTRYGAEGFVGLWGRLYNMINMNK